MSRKYITTTLPYVNAKPHIGHAREFVFADVYKRIYSLMGNETFFNVGTDEHGAKIFQNAQKEKKDTKTYCDEHMHHFKELCERLDISYDSFVRTTDKVHIEVAQKFWRVCDRNGYIYKKSYKIKYCVGCELEKTDSELVEGKCPDHPNQEIEIIEEENHFFRFSKFQKKLKALYKEKPELVQPQKRFNETKRFVESGLEDFSISRLKEKMPWGIEVPGDSEQVMYVWFDALVNYISIIGWSYDMERFEKWWPATQFCGKDNLRQQSVMWQAMLLAVDLPNSEKIFIHGHITVGGQKMSKSLGNVIDPVEMISKYGTDATRFLLVKLGIFGEDSDVTWERMNELYNADLANGVGNLASRIITLYKKVDYEFDFIKGKRQPFVNNKKLKEILDNGHLEEEVADIMAEVRSLDKTIEQEKPWELIKSDDEAFRESIEGLARGLYFIGLKLQPFMPNTANKIKNALESKEIEPLFQRIN